MEILTCCLGCPGCADQVYSRKMVVVGDGAVGKSSLLLRFSSNEYRDDIYQPTVMETDVICLELDNKEVRLTVFDTSGQREYDRLRPLAYNSNDVVIICFSLDNPGSLENVVRDWNPEIRHFCGKIPKILVGNKLDLRDGEEYILQNKDGCVTYQQGSDVADKIGAVGYIECSAKNNIGVKNVFYTAIRASLKHRRRR
ncbi:rho-related GTP-binding protein RhoA-D-like [Patella vulgata]|uniref:rho-related GTP-binding protein RhoA-D-like n=1 Tax=Patella vulgata TaxID=6465 RepID=UPI0024A7D1A7|nr:rho-related GTP-binding protein RhoA-D-like [Patella vulgata]